jgi:hypothetical protein
MVAAKWRFHNMPDIRCTASISSARHHHGEESKALGRLRSPIVNISQRFGTYSKFHNCTGIGYLLK